MTKIRPVAQIALAMLLAWSLSACRSDSGTSGPDQSGVSLTISSPTSASAMDTSDATVRLAGTASSDAGIVKVGWVTDRGGEGIANGTESWQTTSIALELGQNRITVTAEDTAGATTSRSLMVNRETGQAGTVTLSWAAPTTRTDGSPLTNLSGYKILYGRMSGIYDHQVDISNPGILTYVIDNLMPGDWYFALTAYDSAGIESDPSNEVVRQIS